VIRLLHVTSGLSVCASNDVDCFGDVEEYSCSYLKNTFGHLDDQSSQWIVCPRFRLRVEGDPVRLDDYIVLKSVKCKNSYLNCVKKSLDVTKFDHIIGLKKDTFEQTSWQIKQLASYEIFEKVKKSEQLDCPLVLAGDFIKLFHQEVCTFFYFNKKNTLKLFKLFH